MEKNENGKSASEITALWEYVADRLDRLRREHMEDAMTSASGVTHLHEELPRPSFGVVPSRAQPNVRAFGRRRPDAPLG